jgi:hypothetical protein
MASKNNNPKARETELVVQELKDEVLIYDLTTNKAFCLNETSAAIWNLCDGKSSVSDITKQLSKQLKQPVTDDLVYLALDQFKQDDLLSGNNEIEIKFDRLSRREAIRKVGFASMVALPLISSLVAPTAAMAQSGSTCRQTEQTCGSGIGECCTGNNCEDTNDDGITTCCRQSGQPCADAPNSCCLDLVCINGLTCGPRGGGGGILE